MDRSIEDVMLNDHYSAERSFNVTLLYFCNVRLC